MIKEELINFENRYPKMSLWKIGRKRSRDSVKKQIKTRLLKYGKNQPGCFKKGEHRSVTTEFKKGLIPHNKGKPHLQKENHPMWKGGVTPETRKLRNSAMYRIWRDACFLRDNFICQDCGAKGYLNVHHIKPWSEFPELRFRVDNGKTLCKQCHFKVHEQDRKKWYSNLQKKN